MGVTLSGKTKNGHNFKNLDMSYYQFFKFRTRIATLIDEELGKKYGEPVSDANKWDAEMTELINKKDLCKTKKDEKLLDFLFAPDTNGEASYGTCKVIYEMLASEPDAEKIGYAGRNDCTTMGDIKKLLFDIYEKKSKLTWL